MGPRVRAFSAGYYVLVLVLHSICGSGLGGGGGVGVGVYVGWLSGVAWLAGIGFTMSLFVGSLAFGDGPMLVSAKVGILIASIMAGAIGWRLLTRGQSAGSAHAAATADANAA